MMPAWLVDGHRRPAPDKRITIRTCRDEWLNMTRMIMPPRGRSDWMLRWKFDLASLVIPAPSGTQAAFLLALQRRCLFFRFISLPFLPLSVINSSRLRSVLDVLGWAFSWLNRHTRQDALFFCEDAP